jgi:hypothetical protein
MKRRHILELRAIRAVRCLRYSTSKMQRRLGSQWKVAENLFYNLKMNTTKTITYHFDETETEGGPKAEVMIEDCVLFALLQFAKMFYGTDLI